MAIKALQNRLIALSRADTWPDAAAEWQVSHFDRDESETACVCGHRIKDVCHLRNAVNGNTAQAGSTCATHIVTVAHHRLLSNLGFTDAQRVVTWGQIIDAHAEGVISPKDFEFYASARKDILQGRQLRARRFVWMLSIEQKVLLDGNQYLWWKPAGHLAA